MGRRPDELAGGRARTDALAAVIADRGLPTPCAELGADSSDETLRAVADTAVLMPTCTKPLTRDEIFDILVECR